MRGGQCWGGLKGHTRVCVGALPCLIFVNEEADPTQPYRMGCGIWGLISGYSFNGLMEIRSGVTPGGHKVKRDLLSTV